MTNARPIDWFNLSPLVRITLLSLYVALTVPLPFLADATQAPVPSSALWVGMTLGLATAALLLSWRFRWQIRRQIRDQRVPD